MMMKKNTIQGYLGGGYVQPLGYQRGGRTNQLMARISAMRKQRAGQDAIADATASAQSAKNKILGYGKGLASLAGLAAPLVANAILPGSGLLAGAVGKGLVAGGMGALGRFTGEKLGEKLSDAPDAPDPGTWGQKQLDEIKDYRAGLRDDSLERSLASGAVAGVTAGVKAADIGTKLKKLKDAEEVSNVAEVTGALPEGGFKSALGFNPSGEGGLTVGLGEFTPKNAAGMAGYSKGFSFGDLSQANLMDENIKPFGEFTYNEGGNYAMSDLMDEYDKLNLQKGGMINGYQTGGLSSLMRSFGGEGNILETPDVDMPSYSPENLVQSGADFSDIYDKGVSQDSSILKAIQELNQMNVDEAEDRYQQSLVDMDKGDLKSLQQLTKQVKNVARPDTPYYYTDTGEVDIPRQMKSRFMNQPEKLEPMMNPFTGEELGEAPVSGMGNMNTLGNPYKDILELLEEKRGGAEMFRQNLITNPESDAFGNELYTMERRRDILDMLGEGNQMGGMIDGYMGGGMMNKYMKGGMTPKRKNYRGGGLISMMPFNRRIV